MRARLEHFCVVTFRAEVDAVAAQLAEGFEPQTFNFDDGSTGALVSAVFFDGRDFRFAGAPFVRVSGAQIDYRAYVHHRGERGVWFLGTSLDHRLVALPAVLWSMPFTRDRIAVGGSDGHGAPVVTLAADGPSGLATCDLWHGANGGGSDTGTVTEAGAAGDPAHVDGFDDLDDALEVLTHPLIGWYRTRGGRVRHYRVAHERRGVSRFDATNVRFELLEALGLIERGAEPHSTFGMPVVDLDVFTPPRSLDRAPSSHARP